MARDFEALLVELTTEHKQDVALWTKSSSEAGMARLEATLDTLDTLATKLGTHVNESEARIKEEEKTGVNGQRKEHAARARLPFATGCFVR